MYFLKKKVNRWGITLKENGKFVSHINSSCSVSDLLIDTGEDGVGQKQQWTPSFPPCKMEMLYVRNGAVTADLLYSA